MNYQRRVRDLIREKMIEKQDLLKSMPGPERAKVEQMLIDQVVKEENEKKGSESEVKEEKEQKKRKPRRKKVN